MKCKPVKSAKPMTVLVREAGDNEENKNYNPIVLILIGVVSIFFIIQIIAWMLEYVI